MEISTRFILFSIFFLGVYFYLNDIASKENFPEKTQKLLGQSFGALTTHTLVYSIMKYKNLVCGLISGSFVLIVSTFSVIFTTNQAFVLYSILILFLLIGITQRAEIFLVNFCRYFITSLL